MDEAMPDSDMPPDRLTQDRLRWDGSVPVSQRFDDPFYSRDDPLGEIAHTFIEGSNLSDRSSRGDLTIAETGFGTGLNFLSAWREFRTRAPANACMTFVSVENAPLSAAELERAHAPFPELHEAANALRIQWPGPVPGVHRLSLGGGTIRLILLFGEAGAMLARQRFLADIWFLDGFAPAKNPDMWRQPVLTEIARLSRPGTALASFTAAGAVRERLMSIGFEITRRPGHGRKRHCIAGVLRHPPPATGVDPWCRPPDPISRRARIAIVGDGIAARSLDRSLSRAGYMPVRYAGQESRKFAASTLPRALIAPKLVRGTEPFPLFWRQAFWDAVRELDAMPDLWTGPRGLVIPDEKDRNHALFRELNWPAEYLTMGEDGALCLPSAGSVDAPALLSRLCHTSAVEADVDRIEQQSGGWGLIGRDGQTLEIADCVILACGPSADRLMGIPSGLRIGAGQMLMGRPARAPEQAVLRNGYVTGADADGMIAIGATVAGHAPIAPVPVSSSATDEILARHRDVTGPVTGIEPWTGLRCDAGDHLPITGPVQDPARFALAFSGLRHGKPIPRDAETPHRQGLFALTGLGARGFQAAFLLADHMTAMLTGNPSPLEADITDALLPARFQVREIKRNQ